MGAFVFVTVRENAVKRWGSGSGGPWRRSGKGVKDGTAEKWGGSAAGACGGGGGFLMGLTVGNPRRSKEKEEVGNQRMKRERRS